jgi:hypothetical protein
VLAGKVLQDAASLSSMQVVGGSKVMLIASQGLHQGVRHQPPWYELIWFLVAVFLCDYLSLDVYNWIPLSRVQSLNMCKGSIWGCAQDC